MINKYSLLLGLALVLSLSETSLGHFRIKAANGLVPRSNNAGLKSGPCGGATRTGTPRVYAPGDTMIIEWEETVNHPGRYEFYFSEANDSNFTILKTVVDTQDSAGNLPHRYSTSIVLPTKPCSNCTIQAIQVMTDRSPPSNYYSCVDIRLETPSGENPPRIPASSPPQPTTTEPTHTPESCD